jgi:hypothetical protein
MKHLLWLTCCAAGLSCSTASWASYPAGIWQASSKTEIVTLMVLPDGLFYGQVALAPAGYGCVYLIAGNFVHGGTASIEANYTSLQSPYLEPSACKAEGGGGAVASMSGASLKLLVSTTSMKATWLLAPLKAYDSPSSLTLIAGQWVDPWTQRVEYVYTDGAFTAYDPASGCSESGQYSVVDATHALYAFVETLSGCESMVAHLNGVQLRGAATIESGRLARQGAYGMIGVADGTGVALY